MIDQNMAKIIRFSYYVDYWNKVDGSHIYGVDTTTQNALRSFQSGKMKVRIINDEAFPPLLRDAPGVHMIYPPHIPDDEKVL